MKYNLFFFFFAIYSGTSFNYLNSEDENYFFNSV